MTLTNMQEAFCQAMLKEKTQLDAYRKAYPLSRRWKDSTTSVKASELMKNGKIVVRLNELKSKIEAKVIDKILYSKLEHFKELEEEQKFAKQLENPSVSLKATELKGKLCGHYQPEEQSNITNNTQIIVNFIGKK